MAILCDCMHYIIMTSFVLAYLGHADMAAKVKYHNPYTCNEDGREREKERSRERYGFISRPQTVHHQQ